MLPLDKVQGLISKHSKLEKDLSSGDIDKNTFAMDTPEGYLLAYANSKLTLSNRVHANVATLSYGNSSMYFSDSKRASLLDRLGLGEIYNKPMSLNPDLLEDEKNGLLNFIKNNI